MKKFLAFNGDEFFNHEGKQGNSVPTSQDFIDKGVDDYSLLTKRNNKQIFDVVPDQPEKLRGTITRITINKNEWFYIDNFKIKE